MFPAVKTMRVGAGVLSHSCRPSPAIYEQLRSHELDCWWNLAEELGELVTEMRRVAREVLWGKIRDFHAPTDVALFDQQLEYVCAALRDAGRVHVSCFGGIGRTGMAIAAIRVRSMGEAPDDALSAAFETCGGPLTEDQHAFVYTLAQRIGSGSLPWQR